MSILDIFKKHRASQGTENYIENSETAIAILSNYLAKYQGAKSRSLEKLIVWAVKDSNPRHVEWADATFKTKLVSALHQEQISGIKEIDLRVVPIEELSRLNDISECVAKNRIYISFHKDFLEPSLIKDTPVAWLECINGTENVKVSIYMLNPTLKSIWYIGRMEHPTITSTNDIVIKDSCKSISRQHATIVAEDGEYYLDCRLGGCRSRGGSVTKIIRVGGREDELISIVHKSVPPLKEGDIIELAKTVYYRFTLTNPSK